MENPDGDAMVSLSEIRNAGGETSFRRRRRNDNLDVYLSK